MLWLPWVTHRKRMAQNGRLDGHPCLCCNHVRTLRSSKGFRLANYANTHTRTHTHTLRLTANSLIKAVDWSLTAASCANSSIASFLSLDSASMETIRRRRKSPCEKFEHEKLKTRACFHCALANSLRLIVIVKS